MGPEPGIPGFSVDVVPAVGGGRTTVAVAGEVDLATAGELGHTVRDALRRAPVLVDLADVTFMDSSGIRVLDALLKDAAREGWDLVFGAAMRDNVVQALELTGMMGALPLAGDPGDER